MVLLRRADRGAAHRRQGGQGIGYGGGAMTEVSTIPDLLRKRAAEAPNAAAMIVDGRGSMSYGEWDARSNAIARGLVGRGVVAGDRVALFFENSEWLEFAVAYFAVLKAGAVAIPLS